MSIKLSKTHIALLNSASQRDDRCALPPKGPKLTQARKAAAKLIEAGLLREVKAKKDAPIWRREEKTGHAYALKLTVAGIKAIAGERAIGDGAGEEPQRSEAKSGSGAAANVGTSTKSVEPDEREPRPATSPILGAPRAGTKISKIIAVLGRPDGATIGELIAATGWLPHTTRAALTGLRKRGYELILDRSDRARGSIYRIAAKRATSDPAGEARDTSMRGIAGSPAARARRRAAASSEGAIQTAEAP